MSTRVPGRFALTVSRLRGSVLKLAVFIFVCLMLMAWLVTHIASVHVFGHRDVYSAQLADASGLQAGNAVKVAGISVGTVDSVHLQRGHALVTFEVNRPMSFRTSTDVGTRWRDVLGSEDLYLYPGTAGSVLRTGSTIPMSHDITDASVAKFLNSLGPFLGAIDPRQANSFVESVVAAIQGDDSQINQLIDSSATVSQTVGALDQEIGQLVSNVSTVISALASKNGDIATVIGNLQVIAQSLADRNGVLEGVVTNLSVASQEFGQLVGQNQGDLADAITKLNAVFAEIAQERSSLAAGLGSLGPGLAPYTEISQYGQWFQIRTVYSCMANESSCTYYEGTPATEPKGTPPFIPQGSPNLGSLFGALAGGGGSGT